MTMPFEFPGVYSMRGLFETAGVTAILSPQREYETALAVNIALHIAVCAGKRVGIWEPEGEKKAYCSALLGTMANIGVSALRETTLRNADHALISTAARMLKGLPLYICSASLGNIGVLTATMTSLVKPKRLHLVVMDCSNNTGDRHLDEWLSKEAFWNGIRELAKTLGIAIVVLLPPNGRVASFSVIRRSTQAIFSLARIGKVCANNHESLACTIMEKSKVFGEWFPFVLDNNTFRMYPPHYSTANYRR